MLNQLFRFINDKWKLMPQPVQIFTYLLIVFLFAYLLLSPQYIDGKLMGINEDGKEFAIQHEVFELDVDGRTIRFVTNGRGRFAIPKPNKFPLKGTELTFFPEGTGDGSPEETIVVPLSDTVFGRTKIINTSGIYSIEDEKQDTRFLFERIFMKSAYASDEKAQAGDHPVIDSVYETFKKELPTKEINSTTQISELPLTNAQLSSIYANIEHNQNIVINTDRNNIKTISDLSNIVMEQKEPQKWNQILQSTPVKPKRSFWRQYILPVKNTSLSIKPVKVLSDTVKVEILSEESGVHEPIFTGNIYIGERVNIESNGEVYSFQLEKIDEAGFDRFFNPSAAFFSVNRK